jgi:hypothetical protein
MQQNILTFREWNDNHVKVKFDRVGSVEVYSFGELVFKSNNKETIQKYKDNQSKELLIRYKKHFNQIQKNFTEMIDNLDIVS